MNANHLEIELLRLRDENAKLRKALKENGRHSRRIKRAHDAALLLAIWHVGHMGTSRGDAKSRGLSQRTWENAMALLRLARVVSRRRWEAHDIPTIERALQGARDRAMHTPSVYFMWLSKHRQP